MRTNRPALRALLSCALASPAAAQFHDVAFTVEHGQGHPRVDTTVGASASRVVVATNHRLELRNASDGSLRDGQGRVVGSTTPPTTFPFELSDPSGVWRDPRAEYDSANDRLWVVYWEGDGILHFAVSKDNSSPDTWDDWHYFTGSDAIDLNHDNIPQALRVNTADHPSINIDDDFLYISVLDFVPDSMVPFPPGERRSAVASVPHSHSGGSMLSGARPDESEIEVMQLTLLPEPFEDNGVLHYPVQEPHEQFTPAQFFICTSEGPVYPPECEPPLVCDPPPLYYDGVQTQIRLAARYFDSGTSEWKWIFHDMDIDSSTLPLPTTSSTRRRRVPTLRNRPGRSAQRSASSKVRCWLAMGKAPGASSPVTMV